MALLPKKQKIKNKKKKNTNKSLYPLQEDISQIFKLKKIVLMF